MRYDVKGNIESKSDIGSYTYDNEKIHAVSKISHYENSPLKNSNQQLLEYNPFHRPEKIIDEGNGLRYEIIYGTDSERKITYNYRNDELQTTKHYSGLYEKEIMKKDGSREFHFIPGGDGIAAVHIINNGNAGSGITYYFVNDHLGSVIALIDKDQNIIEEHSYDPWGNPRNHRNWSFDNVNTSFICGRGYTFHEMLPQFGLINMNARLYDPVTARVLSPDNYVQSPLNAQNYNRYSYCFNNPLKYSDPTGNAVWTPFTQSDQSMAKNVVRDEYGFSYGPNGRINNFGETFGQSPWFGNNGVFTEASGARVSVEFTEHIAEIRPGPLCYLDKNNNIVEYDTGIGYKKENFIRYVYILESSIRKERLGTGIIDNVSLNEMSNGFKITNNVIGGASVINSLIHFDAAINSAHTLKYAQKVNGVVISAAELTKISQTQALKTLNLKKSLGNKLGVAGGLVTAADILYNSEIKASHGINVFMTGIAFTGWGAIVSGVWFAADIGTGLITGKSISDRIDSSVGAPLISW